MGKKKRLSKHAKYNKYKLKKHEFVSKICSDCGLCIVNADPIFCYSVAYLENPKLFIKKIWPILWEIAWTFEIGTTHAENCSSKDIEHLLAMSFCSNNCQYKELLQNQKCKHLPQCLEDFRRQMKGFSATKMSHKNKYKQKKKSWLNTKSKRKKKKTRKVIKVSPKPTFFCNKEFCGEIRRILDGNNSGE